MSKDEFNPVLLNLFVLIFVLGVITAYILDRTDWGPLLGGVFAFSGIFAWFAFLLNLLSDETKKQLQGQFEYYILRGKCAWAVMLAGVITAFLAFPTWNGTIVMNGLNNTERRVVKIRRIVDNKPSNALQKTFTLPAHADVSVVLSTGLFSSRTYEIKVSGAPAYHQEIAWFGQEIIIVPDNLFERPVLLLRPYAKIAYTAASGEYRLEVLLNDTEIIASLPDYAGEAVWVGGDDDLEVSTDLLRRWRAEFIDVGLEENDALLWESPRAEASTLFLKPGNKITATLTKGDKTQSPFAVYDDTIKYPTGPTSFPQEGILRRVEHQN